MMCNFEHQFTMVASFWKWNDKMVALKIKCEKNHGWTKCDLLHRERKNLKSSADGWWLVNAPEYQRYCERKWRYYRKTHIILITFFSTDVAGYWGAE